MHFNVIQNCHMGARRTKKEKNTSLECLGHKRGTKLNFSTLLILIVKLIYLIVIQ